ncbi:hypothetical protein PAPHI01_1988 [Pancytospora philotis]|nr:hypothetical protein PAPHI01_1988 [Pancytospora philotis]
MDGALSKVARRSVGSIDALAGIIARERHFQIQVFSLESCEVFEAALTSREIRYSKKFTSGFTGGRGIALLLEDAPLSEVPLSSKILLYSNARDTRFLPYKFTISEDEKDAIVPDKRLCQIHKHSSLTAMLRKSVARASYTAAALSPVQAVLMFCLLREKKFDRICREAQQVDGSLDNRFVIQCELNALVKWHYCTRRDDSYSINVSKDTLQEICKRIGFEKALQ